MRGFAAGKTMYQITNAFFLSPFFSPTVPIGLRDFPRKDVEPHSMQPVPKEGYRRPLPTSPFRLRLIRHLRDYLLGKQDSFPQSSHLSPLRHPG
jgi:hypothetical protein